MKKRPSALLLFTLGSMLIALTLVLAGTIGEGVILTATLAAILILLGLIKTYQSERALSTLGLTISRLVDALDRDLASPTAAASSDELRSILELASQQDASVWAETCHTLFSRLETTVRELRHMSAEWEKTFDSVEDGIVILDQERRILRINRAAAAMLDLNRDNTLGFFCCGAIHRDGCDPENCPALLVQAAAKGVRGELSPKGENDILEVFTTPLVDINGEPFGSVHLLRDISKELHAARQAQEILRFDTLTGLPNRSSFRTELQRAAENSIRQKTSLAVLLINLDGFSVINDGLGHIAGDRLLVSSTTRLREILPETALLSRLGGDEFAISLPYHDTLQPVLDLAQAILAAFSQPFQIQDAQPFFCTASIGISTCPNDAGDASLLLKHADIAMYHAKEHGRNTFRTYAGNMDTQALSRLRIGTNLRHALARNEFELHYQPRYDLKTRAMTGMEALLRWNNQELGRIPPASFIPMAEENGLIIPIGRWVLHTACRQVQLWREQGLNPPKIAVNLSALQLKRDDLVETVTEALQQTGLPADLLELELTETVLMSDAHSCVDKLDTLRSLGIHIALDDFGTGYSSLNYLKTFPIDHIKIDRSFVNDLCGNPDDASIVEVIISIAHTLGLNVIAEGIETEAQLDYLIEHQCDEIQGFYFSPPVPAASVTALFALTGDEARAAALQGKSTPGGR